VIAKLTALMSSKTFRRTALVLLAAAVLSGAIVTVVVISTMQALLQRENCGTGPSPSGGPSGSPTYVNQEPSPEALADIPKDYLDLIQKAGRDHGIDWTPIAGIYSIESDFGRLEPGCEEGPPTPYGTAKGPGQFLDSTWASAGVDGDGDGVKDPCNPADAIPATARYLVDNGAPTSTSEGDWYQAIYAYNHADWYVEDVLARAERYRAASQQGGAPTTSMPAIIPAPGKVLGPVRSALGGTAGFVRPLVGVREAEASQLGDDLVDENLNLHYKEYTAYDSALQDGANDWNALGVVNIAPTPSDDETDITISDVEDLSAVGRTYYNQGGEEAMYINASDIESPGYPDGELETEKLFTHELGHAIGLAHPEDYSGPAIMHQQDEIQGYGLETPSGPTDYDTQEFRERWGEARRDVPVNDGGNGGGGVEGNRSAVFPLPEDHMDSYSDDWGNSRGAGRLHEGTDLFAPDGTPIYSITDGTVTQSQWNELGGWIVMIEAKEDAGMIKAGDQLYYAHQVEASPLSVGDEVKAGDPIGKVGSTGEGPQGTLLQPPERGRHLHLGWYDPSGARAEVASGAMNPYPLLEWLEENGGTASGSAAGGLAQAPCNPENGGGLGGSGGAAGGSGDAKELLADPNFGGSDEALSDLESGIVDPRLIATLQAITAEHKIYVSVFATGHPYGATIPGGSAGAGAQNTHKNPMGNAGDISVIDDRSVLDTGPNGPVNSVGGILLGLDPRTRPDEIIGPTGWVEAIGSPSREDGFISDPGLTSVHENHLHLGYPTEDPGWQPGPLSVEGGQGAGYDVLKAAASDAAKALEEDKRSGAVDGDVPVPSPQWADDGGIWQILDRESDSTQEQLNCDALNPMPSGGDPAGGSTSGDGSHVYGAWQMEAQNFDNPLYHYAGGYDAARREGDCHKQAVTGWLYVAHRHGGPAQAWDHYAANGYY